METITINNKRYIVRFESDPDVEFPWNNEDGHGPVRESPYPCGQYGSTKKPGERPLNRPGRNEYQFYYDWQAACKLARIDGWNVAPFDAPNRIQRAVESDFDYLRRFLAGDWEYIGVIVESEEGEEESLWGVESEGDYKEQLAQELAEVLDSRIRRDEQSRIFPVSVMGI